MNEVLSRVRESIRRHALADADTRVVVAVSGGSDSIALLRLVHELAASGDLHLAGVAHFNHQLRTTADRDEAFCRAAAESLGLEVLSERADVRARAKDEKRSIEDAGRAARYEFFERARIHFGADAVALGHTRDDQAETFLLRLLRGAGPRGLAGMYPRNGRIIRPLIDCRREALRSWLGERGIPFVDDESNADVSIPRNRVRAELLPLLASRFNPAIVDVLAGEADLMRETWDFLERQADEIASRIVKASDRIREFDVDAFRRVPVGLRRVVLWRAMNEAAGSRPVGFEHVADALRLFDEDGPAVLDAPGHRLERIGPRVVLTDRPPDATSRRTHPNLFEYSLSIPGEVAVPEAGFVVSAEAGADTGEVGSRAIAGNGPVAAVRRDLCRECLTVRNRRDGDRFRPVGLKGRKKLQDFFVDRKVRRADRDSVPIVVDENGGIVWVAGYGIDEAFRVTDPAQAVLLLRLRRR